MKEMRQMRGKTKIKDMTMTISSFLADLFSLEKKIQREMNRVRE